VARAAHRRRGENTFGGFLSPDDRFLYFVRAERHLVRLALDTCRKSGLHRARRLGGLRHLGGQQRLHEDGGHRDRGRGLVPAERLAQVRRDVPRASRAAGCSASTCHRPARGHPGAERLAGPPAVPPLRRPYRGLLPRRPARPASTRACGSSTKTARTAAAASVHAPGESCTHEFWVPDGSAMVYVSYFKDQPERWIRSLDPVTLEDRP
jgi:oligogalacturonide lyase